jgi:hypothetical protein
MRTLANRGCLIRDAPFSLVRSSVAVPQNVLLGDRGAGKTFKTKITHFAVYARVNQSVTGCYKFVVEPGSPVYPPFKAARSSSSPYSPKCLEEELCELRLYRVVGSATHVSPVLQATGFAVGLRYRRAIAPRGRILPDRRRLRSWGTSISGRSQPKTAGRAWCPSRQRKGREEHRGIGRENGLESLKECTQVKSVWVELTGKTRDPFTLG